LVLPDGRGDNVRAALKIPYREGGDDTRFIARTGVVHGHVPKLVAIRAEGFISAFVRLARATGTDEDGVVGRA
jgi:hypothetical protein